MELRGWHNEKVISKTVRSLEDNFFTAKAFKSRDELVEHVLENIQKDMKVGLGGSVTVRSLGLLEKIKEKGAILLLDHWREGLTPEEVAAIRIQQLTSDLFLTSANAITENGEIVNIDGIGNRINAMTYGPKKVFIIAGINKIVPDINYAIERIKRIAAPMNAKRLNLPLPCAETGYCHDCKSEKRICRILSVMMKKPGQTDISVFIVNEELGY